jgi:hypothetical protein
MLDLFEELTAVAEALDRAAIPYALVGGLAYSLYVEARATEDIDLLVYPDDWDKIPELLKPLGFRDRGGDINLKSVRIRRLVKIQDRDALVVDFLLADGALRDGVDRAVTLDLGKATVRVAPPETIIALKKNRLSAKDKDDIAGLEKLLGRGKGEP